jgi:hypothetical protein
MALLNAGTVSSVRTHAGTARWAGRLGVIVLMGMVFSASARGQLNEYQLKAAFLYNFAKFVEWPAQTFKGPADPIVICIFGQNPFGNILNETITGKVVGGRTLEVRQISESQSVQGCPILFVSAAASKRFRAIAGTLKGSGVLSVGEADGFISDGGIVNFKVEHGNIRLEINIAAAECSQVYISSKLLSLAQVVRRTP